MKSLKLIYLNIQSWFALFVILSLALCYLLQAKTNVDENSYLLRITGNGAGGYISDQRIVGTETYSMTPVSGKKLIDPFIMIYHIENSDILNWNQSIINNHYVVTSNPQANEVVTDHYINGKLYTSCKWNGEKTTSVIISIQYTMMTEAQWNPNYFKSNDVYPVPWEIYSNYPSDVTPYTEETTDIQSSCVWNTAFNICDEATTVTGVVEKLTSWMVQNIVFNINSSKESQDAKSVFDNKEGYCRGWANLMCAFLRALDIPARIIVGDKL